MENRFTQLTLALASVLGELAYQDPSQFPFSPAAARDFLMDAERLAWLLETPPLRVSGASRTGLRLAMEDLGYAVGRSLNGQSREFHENMWSLQCIGDAFLLLDRVFDPANGPASLAGSAAGKPAA